MEVRGLCEDEDNNWSDAAIVENTKECWPSPYARKTQERNLLYSLHRKHGPADTLISDY